MKGVKVTVDRVAEVMKSINDLVNKDVLIGIPESTDERKDEDPINNASLGYIHEYGSPARNIPARPFLIPGVINAQEKAIGRLKKAATAALDGDNPKAERELEAAGLIGQNSVRSKINNGPFKPLKEVTIERRLARGRTGDKPLIDTGQLRNSITYVVRKKK